MQCQLLATVITVLIGLSPPAPASGPAMPDVLQSPETSAIIGYSFSEQDAALLDEIQKACFLYFWKETGDTGLTKDRRKAPVSSIAAVGFQLSSLPIAVEHGWVTRGEAEQRAVKILHAILDRNDNKKFGLYYHFLDYDTAAVASGGYEVLVSTVDSALLMAGAIPAAEYFGGETKALVDGMLRDADWKAFAVGPGGAISMGWEPNDHAKPTGDGTFHRWCWRHAADEERLVYFLAVAAERSENAVEPAAYYRLDRTIKRHDDMPPFVVSPQGALFQHFFSHCWIDYRKLGADRPALFGVDAPRIDWFENSRRAILTQRQRCIEVQDRFKTLAPDRWGLSACAGRDGYMVPEIQPNLCNRDKWYEGTVAPYAAGSSIMFTPAESLAALRAFRGLDGKDGRLRVWWDPSDGGYGLVDAFNLDQGFASDDYVGIDHGPMLLAIENARSGLIWRLFMSSETAKRGVERLKLGR